VMPVLSRGVVSLVSGEWGSRMWACGIHLGAAVVEPNDWGRLKV
jgi:hypothetical protein